MGNDPENPFQTWKNRFKRLICAGTLMVIFGLVFIAIAIAMLVKYGKFWSDADKKLQSGLSYFGVAILILGLLLFFAAVVIFVTLCIVYNEYQKNQDRRNFRPPQASHFPGGKVPYPVQPGWMPEPTAPMSHEHIGDKYGGVGADSVHVDVTAHHKF